MLKIVKYLLIWLSGVWISILVAVLFGKEAELARASSVAAQGVAFWAVRAASALAQALAVAGQLSLTVADHSGAVIASSISFIGHNAAECVLFSGRVLGASALFAGGALSGTLNYSGAALAHSLDYLGAAVVATWRFFVEVLTNLASRRSLFAIFFLIFMYHFFMRPAQLRQLVSDALFLPVRDACREVWRCLGLAAAALSCWARPGEAAKALAVAALAAHLWRTLFPSAPQDMSMNTYSSNGASCSGEPAGTDLGRVKLDVYS
jgi:hypothetical protein